MTNFKTKITTAVATGAVLLQAMAPLSFASTIEISGNGAGSDNTANVKQTSTTTVNQSNNADVTNKVEAKAKTGNNDANFNTGGNVTVDTGDAEATATVTNNLNSNVAQVDCCGVQDTDVLVSGNGAQSDNDVVVRGTNTTTLNQNNNANVRNNVDVAAVTGGNDAGFNTGGDVVVKTGKATVDANVTTNANSNWAHIGSNGDTSSNVSLKILNNGAGSDNNISAKLANTTTLSQWNDARVRNDVDAQAKTGNNDANFNTGDGDVVIDTGDALATATVDNAVNFNAADVDCGCVYGLTAKIAGNGADAGLEYDSDSDNTITADLSGVQAFGQGNLAKLNNDLAGREGVEAKTGNNEASGNTSGSEYSDPSVKTGDAETGTNVSNSGNHNILGDVDFPAMDFDWDFSGMWAFFGMMMHN